MDEKQQEQYNYYKKKAENFDKKRMNSNHLYKIEEIGKEIFKNFSNSISCLEMGGGTGLHAEKFLNKYINRIELFVLSDLSAEMLNQAKKRLDGYGSKVQFAEGAGENFKYKNVKFDAIYISGAMHHFSDYNASIKNAKSNLKDDGIIVVCEPIIQNPYSWLKVIFMKEEWGQFKVTRRNVCRSLTANGYEIIGNRVLHYRSNNAKFRFIQKAGRFKILDWLAVMFLITARKK